MKRTTTILATAALLFSSSVPGPAQTSTQTTEKSLAATLGVYVFPQEGQNAQAQSKAEADCYAWAVQQTGSDPFAAAKNQQAAQQQAAAQQQQIAQSGQGAGAKGAVGGAAAGALIGEIASDDAGEGAAWGAAIGAVGARRRSKKQQAAASQQVAAQSSQTQAASQQQIDSFKKAFSACLEGKKYMVKY
jgi:hypothetical protein